jgi:hypothetical protein
MREVRSSSFDHPGFLAPLAIAIAGVAFGCSGATGDANLGGGNYDSAPRVDASDDGSDDATLRDTGADTSVKADGGSDSTTTDGAGGAAKTDGTASDGGDAIADGTTDGGGDALGDGAIDGGGLDASADGEGGAACGAPGDVCCAGGTCAGGALCVSGKCGTCGGPGLVCCSGTPSCSTGSVCSGGACVKCGGLGEKCCSGSACSTGFVCNTTLDTCARCGGIGEPCCAGGACSTGGVCDGTTLRCACGGPGQPCCAGGTCTGSALCTTAGTCSSCGGVGQPCCAGGGCLGLNVCDTGTCKAPSGCTKESDCTGTGKCGGPSTCAGSVCFVCYTPPASATSSGRAACTDSSTCASNLCDELRGHCSAPCSNTTASRDTDCTSYLGAGYLHRRDADDRHRHRSPRLLREELRARRRLPGRGLSGERELGRESHRHHVWTDAHREQGVRRRLRSRGRRLRDRRMPHLHDRRDHLAQVHRVLHRRRRLRRIARRVLFGVVHAPRRRHAGRDRLHALIDPPRP